MQDIVWTVEHILKKGVYIVLQMASHFMHKEKLKEKNTIDTGEVHQ